MPVKKISKSEIIEKSLEVFRRQGFHRTSMADLAVACGLYKGSFYHYFDSKETLMKEVLEGVDFYLRNKIYPIAYETDLSPYDRLEKLLKKFSKTVFNPDYGCLIGNISLETATLIPEFRIILQSVFTGWSENLTYLYAHNHPLEIAKKLADQTIMEYEGAVMMSKVLGNTEYFKDCYERALQRMKT